jgi:hypothetical protein
MAKPPGRKGGEIWERSFVIEEHGSHFFYFIKDVTRLKAAAAR